MNEVYETLAALLEYPDERWTSRIETARQARCSSELQEFLDRIKTLSLTDLQELYTRTFDLNPVCALEIGYHLFGENYKRGEFLANLRETEAPFDLGQQQQLPDYLPVLLRLLTTLEDEELRLSLISECLIPGIQKMLGALKQTDNPYQWLLESVLCALRLEVPTTFLDSTRLSNRASLPVIQSVGGRM